METRPRRFGDIDALLAATAATLRARSTGIREAVDHRGEKGRGHEALLVEELGKLLPRRIGLRTGFVIGAGREVSDQLDIVLCDVENYPTFGYEAGHFLLPESVQAVISVKTRIRPSDVPTYFEEAVRFKKLMLDALGQPWAGIYVVLGYLLEGSAGALTDRYHAEMLKVPRRGGVEMVAAIDKGPIGIDLATFGAEYSLPPAFVADRSHIPGIAMNTCMIESAEPFVDIFKLLVPRLDPERLARVVALTRQTRGEVLVEGVTTDPAYRAVFVGKSADLMFTPGMPGNYQIFYANVGTASWVRQEGTDARLVVAGPRDYRVPREWNTGWLDDDTYASQVQDTVPPGSLATFSYFVQAPNDAQPGLYRFYGRPAIRGIGALVPETRANGAELTLEPIPLSARLVMGTPEDNPR